MKTLGGNMVPDQDEMGFGEDEHGGPQVVARSPRSPGRSCRLVIGRPRPVPNGLLCKPVAVRGPPLGSRQQQAMHVKLDLEDLGQQPERCRRGPRGGAWSWQSAASHTISNPPSLVSSNRPKVV